MRKYLCSLSFLIVFYAVMTGPALAQADYDNALCVSNGKRERKCSVTVTRRAIVLKYPDGRSEILKRSRIHDVLARDESVRKGFIFTSVDRRYLYSIQFDNIDGERELVSIAFDNYDLSKEFDSLLGSY